MATNLQKYKRTILNSPAKTETVDEATASSGRPLHDDPASKSGMQSSGDGFNFLSSALNATFFFDYFEHVANKTYGGGRTDLKVIKLKNVHPRFHQHAIQCDFVGRVAVYVLLVAFASMLVGGAIWKTIIK